jgi:outer membrane protein OmpA-like peptidoglycan-associated protein
MRKVSFVIAVLAVAPVPAFAQSSGGAPPPAVSPTAPPTSPPPEVAPPAVDPEIAAWNARQEALFETDAITGGVGLLRTQHAESGLPGQFRMGLVSDFFRAGFLCTKKYPCPNPAGGADLTQDTMSHVGASLTLSVSILKWLEAYGVTSISGDSDSANHPALLQVLGDSQLGLKAFAPLTGVFHAGGAAELDLVNGSGAVGLVGNGTGAKLRLLGTADLRELSTPFPLRISLNTTYTVDDTAEVLASYEAAEGAPATRIDRFGLEVNRVDHFDINLGLESFLAAGLVRPFVEYGLLIPIDRQQYPCQLDNASHDGCLATDKVVPSTLTLGSRFFPWRRNFSAVVALDIGVSGVKNFIEELSPTPPWMLYLGLGWAVDTADPPRVEKTKVVERVIPPKELGHLAGLVHAKDQSAGIADAIVVFDDHPDITSRATGADGRFSIPVDPGSYKLVVHAKGYKDGNCAGTMGPVPADVPVDCPLEPALVQVTATEITIEQQIQFQVDSAIILPESDALMREIADTLIKNPRITQVEVQGHTDSSGTAEYNQKLSEQRATAVKDWLIAHGVPDSRLYARGYGESQPLIPNVTKALKAQNRRVQFIIRQQTPAKSGD